MDVLGDSAKTKRLIASIEHVVDAHGRTRVNGKVASERTFRLQMDVMKQFARTLHEKGFLLEDCRNLGEKHLNAVFDCWALEKKLATKTLQNQKSRVKQFVLWLGKPELARYVSRIEERYRGERPEGFRVRTVADRSKSERGAGLDLDKLYRAALAHDTRYAAMLMMQRAFGLRKKEVLLAKLRRADLGDKLQLVGSVTKNGRAREIKLDVGEYGKAQRKILDYAKSLIKQNESLAWPGLSLLQAERRYYACNNAIGLTKSVAGMTGHGLRAGYAEDVMLLAGLLPSSLGGTTEMRGDAQLVWSVKLKASEALGHSREVITHAYYGSDWSFAKAGELLGYRVGTPINGGGLAGEAQLWVSEKPEPIEGVIGQYTLTPVKAELAVLTIQLLEGGQETDRVSIGQFIERYPSAKEELVSRLGMINLCLELKR